MRGGGESGIHLRTLLWVLALTPMVSGMGSRVGVVVLHAVVGCTAIVLMALTFDGKVPRKLALWASYFLAGFILFLGRTLMSEVELTTGAMLDLIRPWLYCLYFVAGWWLMPSTDHGRLRLVNTVFAICIAQVAFSSLVHIPAAHPFVDFFKGRPSTDLDARHFYRWSGTFGYPSDFSFFLSYCLYLGVNLEVARVSSGQLLRRTALLFAVVGFAMTFSRGGYAALAVMSIIGSVLYWGSIRFIGLLVALFLVGLLVTQGWFFDGGDVMGHSYVTGLFSYGIQADSVQHRVREAVLVMDVLAESPAFGMGPDRMWIGSRIRVIESLYGHYIIKWGVVGLGWFLLGLVSMLRVTMGAHDLGASQALRRSLTLIAISVPLVFGFSSAVTDRYKCLPLFYLLAGGAVAQGYRDRAERKASSPWQQ